MKSRAIRSKIVRIEKKVEVLKRKLDHNFVRLDMARRRAVRAEKAGEKARALVDLLERKGEHIIAEQGRHNVEIDHLHTELREL
jgi:hypothetical protein